MDGVRAFWAWFKSQWNLVSFLVGGFLGMLFLRLIAG